MALYWPSSCTDRASVWTSISFSRSSMEICSCCFRFSKLYLLLLATLNPLTPGLQSKIPYSSLKAAVQMASSYRKALSSRPGADSRSSASAAASTSSPLASGCRAASETPPCPEAIRKRLNRGSRAGLDNLGDRASVSHCARQQKKPLKTHLNHLFTL